MDQKIPFTSYDFWAYMSAGFLLLFAADHVWNTGLFARDAWTLIQGVIAVSCAYVVGHLIASLSSVVLERLLVGRLLGYPRLVLFGQPRAWRWVQALLPGYFEALPAETQRAALAKGKSVGVEGPGEALFWPAYAHARAIPAVVNRLENFLNLYGFCRNIALVCLIDSGLLYWSYRWGDGSRRDLYFAVGALVVGIGMTLRYLKFLRHYGIEVFTCYAYGETSKGSSH